MPDAASQTRPIAHIVSAPVHVDASTLGAADEDPTPAQAQSAELLAWARASNARAPARQGSPAGTRGADDPGCARSSLYPTARRQPDDRPGSSRGWHPGALP